MSLFTTHNYRAKKFNYLTLRGKSNVNGLYIFFILHVLLNFFFCKYPDPEAEDASRQQAFETARDDIK
jgi:hypothetical protein